MFIENLLNQTDTSALTELLKFTSQRHKLLAENIVNVDTPGYKQKDLSLDQFQNMLQKRIDLQNSSPPGSVSFDDIDMEIQNPRAGILFHDGNNRSMEMLMADSAKNALMHNTIIELLHKQFGQMEMALRERVG
jgi:flagellar basal-body rod protein FlgB